MITEIQIENFRCFENLKISGFKTLNLIGGKNNAGKTSLLEALYCVAKEYNYKHILQNRYGSLDQEEREKSLFFNHDTSNDILLQIGNTNLPKITNRYSYKVGGILISNKPFNDEKSEVPSTRSMETSTAQVNKTLITSLIFSKNSQFPINLNLTTEFDKLDIKGESGIIVEALQLIDSSIEEIKTYSSKPNMLYLRRKGEKKFMPLNDFGDALQKIVRYIITLTTFEKNDLPKCLLIDEIENGLHYTAHQEFWKMLFRLAKAYEIQIFATSHSLEMIRAFSQVVYQTEYEQDAMYLEMSKTLKTNQIIANPMTMELLHYDILKNNPFRGE